MNLALFIGRLGALASPNFNQLHANASIRLRMGMIDDRNVVFLDGCNVTKIAFYNNHVLILSQNKNKDLPLVPE